MYGLAIPDHRVSEGLGGPRPIKNPEKYALSRTGMASILTYESPALTAELPDRSPFSVFGCARGGNMGGLAGWMTTKWSYAGACG